MCAMRAAPAPGPTETPVSLAELALLALTNGETQPAASEVPTTYTTKDVYVWGALLAAVAERQPNATPEGILDAYNESLIRVQPLVKDFLANWDPFKEKRADSAISDLIFTDILSTLQVPSSLDELKRVASTAYVGLVEKGLIVDPIVLPAAIAIMGLLPVGFTQKTKKGEIVSSRIWGLFWEYERSGPKGAYEYRLEFKLLDFVRAFYNGAVSGFENALSGVRNPRPRQR